jgi:hypothetical protein
MGQSEPYPINAPSLAAIEKANIVARPYSNNRYVRIPSDSD